MRKYLKELKIFIKKLTHAWRVAGSRAKDAAGVDDKVCTEACMHLQCSRCSTTEVTRFA